MKARTNNNNSNKQQQKMKKKKKEKKKYSLAKIYQYRAEKLTKQNISTTNKNQREQNNKRYILFSFVPEKTISLCAAFENRHQTNNERQKS